jgi:hypothetical protein
MRRARMVWLQTYGLPAKSLVRDVVYDVAKVESIQTLNVSLMGELIDLIGRVATKNVVWSAAAVEEFTRCMRSLNEDPYVVAANAGNLYSVALTVLPWLPEGSCMRRVAESVVAAPVVLWTAVHYCVVGKALDVVVGEDRQVFATAPVVWLASAEGRFRDVMVRIMSIVNARKTAIQLHDVMAVVLYTRK